MNEQTIFTVAIERDPAERPAFLDEACGADQELRQRVEKLIGLHENAGDFLEQPAAGAGPTFDQRPLERLGTEIGPYKLLQQIGEGGMGTVFMAEQTQPVQRRVALKIIKAGMDTRQVIARFEAERQALAMMDHVNIARVLDAGTTEQGRPYFVMELVHGVPITKYCDDNHLTPRERLELFVPVCQAIQHAHQKGIIHRDIKPSNVMITLYDGKPVPKVIDFGVAKATEQKLTERTLFTQYGTMVGTLEYMSPDQAEMSALGVDTRSDIVLVGSGIGWSVRDRSARVADAERQQVERQTKLARQVESILTEADRLEGEQKWPEALAAARRAEAAAAGGEADAATAQRVRVLLKDLLFIDRLEQIRMAGATLVEGKFDYAGAHREYAQAFRDYGVDVESLAVETAVDGLKAHRALAIPQAAALDNWVYARRIVSPMDVAGSKRLVAVAHGIDPEPLRDRLRSSWGQPGSEVQDEFRRLADTIDIGSNSIRKTPSPITTWASRFTNRGRWWRRSALIARRSNSTQSPMPTSALPRSPGLSPTIRTPRSAISTEPSSWARRSLQSLRSATWAGSFWAGSSTGRETGKPASTLSTSRANFKRGAPGIAFKGSCSHWPTPGLPRRKNSPRRSGRVIRGKPAAGTSRQTRSSPAVGRFLPLTSWSSPSGTSTRRRRNGWLPRTTKNKSVEKPSYVTNEKRPVRP